MDVESDACLDVACAQHPSGTCRYPGWTLCGRDRTPAADRLPMPQLYQDDGGDQA